MRREVIEGDAVRWLAEASPVERSALVASLPDISEFSGWELSRWQEWFIATARSALRLTPPEGVTIFYQSDIKLNGVWVDKGYLCQQAADAEGVPLRWHKIACRLAPGNASFGRPGYSHVLCFSRAVVPDISRSSADVIPENGPKAWERGMGLQACMMIAKFIAAETPARLVINPFCGYGSMLAASNRLGLDALGIERSPKRAARARVLTMNAALSEWVLGSS